MSRPYKNILSLDGGGAWALIQAMALEKLYPGEDGRQILRRFDLAIGNSGGSLVLGALASGMGPADILNHMFLSDAERGKIFVAKWMAPFTRRLGFGPRYKTAAKLEGLLEALSRNGTNFGATPMEELTAIAGLPDIVITSFDYDFQRAVFFRSRKDSPAASVPALAGPTLAEAMHASSTAPVNYFDEPAVLASADYAHKRFWDGGTAGLNNPVLAGVTEALADGSDPKDLKILSIGTASVLLPQQSDAVQPPLATATPSSCPLRDIKKLARTILDDPPDAASYIAYRILHGSDNRGPSRLIRMNPLIQPVLRDGVWDYPDTLKEGYPERGDTSGFEQLAAMDMDAVQPAQVELIRRFCDLWLNGKVPNQPIQIANDLYLTCAIGHSRFGDAQTALGKLGLC